ADRDRERAGYRPGGSRLRHRALTLAAKDQGRRAMRIRLTIAVAAIAASAPATAQDNAAIPLDYAAAQQRLLERSDAIAASSANVRGKEAQVGATRSLGRPEVEFEAQLLDYQKTLYLPLGSLAP